MNLMQILIDDCLKGTKHVENAAIVSIKTASVVAASDGFNIPPQVQMFIDCFKHAEATRERGFSFLEKSYTCVRADSHSVYSKSNGDGLILVKTELYVIVATYNENMHPGVCVEAVEKLASYLREKGK